MVQKILPRLAFMFLVSCGFGACEKDETSIEVTEVTIKNSREYSRSLNMYGDNERAYVLTQAQHFKISQLSRDASTDWDYVYVYKPERGYVGTDFVEIETCTRGNSGECGDRKILRINFTMED